MCWIVEENESCCPLCGGSCTWGGGKGTAQGSGTGPSGTRAGGGGAQGVVDFQIKLGTLPGEDVFAAIARVRTELPATNWAGAAGLQVLRHGRAEIEVVRGSNGVERIYAPEMDAGVVVDAAGRTFELHCWPKGQYGQGTPPVSWRVEAAEDGAWVRFTKFADGATNSVTEYAAAADGNGLVVTEGGGLRTERIAVGTESGFQRVDVHEVSGPDGAVVERRVEKVGRFFFGDKLVEEWAGATNAAILVRALEYGTNRNEKGSFGRVVARRDGEGAWTRWDYDVEGRVVRETTGWGDAEFGTTNALDTRVVETSYAPADAREWPVMGDRRWRSRTERVRGVWKGTTFRAYYSDGAADWEIVEEAADEFCTYSNAANRRTERQLLPKTADARVRFKPVWEQTPEGRQDAWEYAFGSYTNGVFTAGDGTAFVQVTETRGTNWLEPGRSLRTVRVLDAHGREVLEETWVYAATNVWTRMDWTETERDPFGRVTAVRHADGLAETAGWACCGKEWETAVDGRHWTYANDLLGRTTARLQADGPEEYTDYDAGGRVVARRRTGGDLVLAVSNRYDLAGRRTVSWDEAGLATTYAYGTNTETVVFPGGAVRVTERQRDGRVKSVTGTAVVPQWHAYGVNPDGGEWETVWTGEANGPAWERTVRDRHGRTLRTERPAWGGGVATNGYQYDAAGRLTNEWSTGAAARIHEYDDRGELSRSGIDADGDGTLSLASMDRIREERTRYVELGGEWYAERTSVGYPWDNSDTPFTNGIVRTPVCRSGAGRTETVDARGWTSAVATDIDPATRTVTRTATRPEVAGAEVSVTGNGLLRTRTDPTGATWTYLYDALARPVGTVDPRTGTNTIAYAADGRVAWQEDAAGSRTAYGYDPETGRRIAVTDALSNVVHTAYDLQGRVTNTWGATYPVGYEYDDLGRMTAMHTWRDENAAPDVTRWNYDPATGLLTNKVYADGLGPSYAYDPAGRLAKRTWARGVETDYSYDALGQLSAIDYSDATPDVAFTYDRQGRPLTVTDVLGTRTNVYDALNLLEERYPDGDALVRTYDAYGRAAGIALGTDYAVGYGYDEYGRFSTVAVSNGPTFTYSYVPDSSLLAGYTNDLGLAVAYEYEPHRDVKTLVSNAWGTNTISTFAYTYDALGRRTVRIDDGTTTNHFGYNLRSELTSAEMGTNTYSYAYDPIGNRLSSTENGIPTTYAANSLNQYTALNPASTNPTPFTYDPDGNMTSDGTWSYAWDAENRLIEVQPLVTNLDSTLLQFMYDAQSRRIARREFSWMAFLHDEPTWRYVQGCAYRYDGWNLLHELKPHATPRTPPTYIPQTNLYLTGTTGPVAAGYVWGLDLSATLHGAGGVGGLLQTHRDGTNAFSFYDANGNTIGMTDEVGNVIEACKYDGFGKEVYSGMFASDCSKFRFSTKMKESRLELSYFGYRYYFSNVGGWITRDPVGEKGGVNLYGFIRNQFTKIDYLGLWIWSSQVISYSEIGFDYEMWADNHGPPVDFSDNTLLAEMFANTLGGLNSTLFHHYLYGTGEDYDLSGVLDIRNEVEAQYADFMAQQHNDILSEVETFNCPDSDEISLSVHTIGDDAYSNLSNNPFESTVWVIGRANAGVRKKCNAIIVCCHSVALSAVVTSSFKLYFHDQFADAADINHTRPGAQEFIGGQQFHEMGAWEKIIVQAGINK